MAEERLNLGCGRDIRADWVNLDHPAFVERMTEQGVVGLIGCDIDKPDVRLPFDDNTFDVVEASHVLEHVVNIYPLMEEIWRVLKPGASLMVAVPFGSSDDAVEDPTHVRVFYPGSWCYFSQPTFWKSDYGFAGDFKPSACLLFVDALRYPGGDAQQSQVIEDITTRRNVVQEMRAVLEAIKPARHWSEQESMDTWETRVIFVDVAASPNQSRSDKIEAIKKELWTP